IKTMTGSYIAYSFAEPETIVRKVVVDQKEYGVVQRALLGLTYRPIDQAFLDEAGEELGIDRIGGVYVAGVQEEGAASEAGIRKGDVITAIDGVAIDDSAVLQEQIGRRRPNDKVKLTVKRSGKTKQIEVTLRNKVGKPELLTGDEADAAESLGGKFADAEPSLCKRLEIDGGVQVRGIRPGGILARARVKTGFVITHINDRRVRSLGDLRKMTDKIRAIDGIYPEGRAASYVLVE
ncbi:MAG: PDZ domain-containing protein, partial [Alistipes sp.]|nr:PDZ domain-containing protein [Alistipes sp.]